MNRCDIDKVIGPLFTVLSGQQTTLPYRVHIEQRESRQYVILPDSKPECAEHEFAPGPGWRIIATINSIDKASLYQMSFALSRRFGWIYIDAPYDKRSFLVEFLLREIPGWLIPEFEDQCPIAEFWHAINDVRVIGPAPFIDVIRAVRILEPDADFFGRPSTRIRECILDAIELVILPLLDGIMLSDANAIADAAVRSFMLNEWEKARITRHLIAVAV